MRSILLFILILFGVQNLFCKNPHFYDDALVQKSILPLPQRGNVFGDIGDRYFQESDEISKGNIKIDLPVSIPELREKILANIFPSYSLGGGLREFGMGWSQQLSIKRYRENGDISYDDGDSWMSPWGELIRGNDVLWYSKDILKMRSSIKAEISKNDAIVTDEKGARYIFSAENTFFNNDLAVEFFLSKIESVTGEITTLFYEKNKSGRLFLKDVEYGGSKNILSQYRISLSYTDLPKFHYVDYSNGKKLELDRRVGDIIVFIRSDDNNSWIEKYRYHLRYKEAKYGIVFYLESIQKINSKNNINLNEPEFVFDYDIWDAADLTMEKWNHIPKWDELMKIPMLGHYVFSPSNSTFFDFDNKGVSDFEHKNQYTIIRNGQNSVDIDPYPGNIRHPKADVTIMCFEPKYRRKYYRMKGYFDTPSVVGTNTAMGVNTEMHICNREGRTVELVKIKDVWELRRNAYLVDLNHDGRPDLIRFSNDYYFAHKNISTEQNVMFDKETIQGLLKNRGSSSNGTWILDINGSGFPSIVSKYDNGLRVWAGYGNFKFEENYTKYIFYNKENYIISNLDNYDFDFQDINNDGILDVILYTSENARIFINNGDHFKEAPVEAFSFFIRTMFIHPVTEDLSGSGNVQINIFGDKKEAMVSLDLASSSTGLLRSIDDGKGNKISFNYKKSLPQKDAGPRVTVISDITVSSVGYGTVKKSFTYSGAVRSRDNFGFLGFNFVQVDFNNKKREQYFYKNDEIVSQLLTKYIESDLLIPGLFIETNYSYDESLIEKRFPISGIQALKRVEKLWGDSQQNGAKNEMEVTNYLAYNHHLCPLAVEEKNGHGVLKKEYRYQEGGDIENYLSCYNNETIWQGIHPKPDFDFQHILKTKRDEKGLPLAISLVDRLGGNRLLQKIIYNGDLGYLPSSIEIPGEGKESYYYDDKRRLKQVTDPMGQISKATYGPNSDLLSENDHFIMTQPYKNSYSYDSLERLQKSWDNLGKNSFNDPYKFYKYSYASKQKLGVIEETTRYELDGPSEVDFLYSGNGKDLGQVKEKRVAFGLATFFPDDNRSITKIPFLVEGRESLEKVENYQQMVADLLFLKQQNVSSLMKGALSIKNENRVQGDIVQLIENRWELDLTANVLKKREIENEDLFEEITYSDFNLSRPLTYRNGNGDSYQYRYDVLGRLRQIEMPNYQMVSVEYDDFGQKKSIQREPFKVDYQYDQKTGKLIQKKIGSNQGNSLRVEKYQWNSAGQMVSFKKEDSQFQFEYDDYGLLKQVQSNGILGSNNRYQKNISYRLDGNVESKEIQLPLGDDFFKIVQNWDYTEDSSGRINSKQMLLYKNGTLIDSIHLFFKYNSLGAISKIYSESGKYSVNVMYNSFYNIERILFNDGNSLSYRYDDVTQNYKETHFKNSNSEWDYGIQFNNRSLIESELLQEKGSLVSFKNYVYDRRKYLESSTDRAKKRDEIFSYDEVGMISTVSKLFDEKGVRNGNVNITPFGEFTKIGNDRIYSYGTNGRIKNVFSTSKGGPFPTLIDFIGTPLASYIYDEDELPLAKMAGSGNRSEYEIYLDNDVLFSSRHGLIHPITIENKIIGHFMDKKGFIPAMADLRNSYLVSQQSHVSVPSAYGDRERLNDSKNSNDDTEELSIYLDFAQKGYDPDLKLVRMGKRHYSSELGSFTTADPLFLENPEKCIESPVECNLYSYAGNNPVNKIDPTGLFEIDANFHGDRNSATKAGILDDFGNYMHQVSVLGKGKDKLTQWDDGGDTPTGRYSIGKVEIGGKWDKKVFGSAKIHINPISGIAKESKRTLLRIHGGQSGTERWDATYLTAKLSKDRDNLRPTIGCLRMSNENIVDVANIINYYREYRKSQEYLSEKMYYESVGVIARSKDILHVR